MNQEGTCKAKSGKMENGNTIRRSIKRSYCLLRKEIVLEI